MPITIIKYGVKNKMIFDNVNDLRYVHYKKKLQCVVKNSKVK